MPSGRVFGSKNKPKLIATEIAKAVLASVDQVGIWKKHVEDKDARVSLDALKYLSDRMWGKPMQQVQGGSSMTVNFVWGSTPQWANRETPKVLSNTIELKADEIK